MKTNTTYPLGGIVMIEKVEKDFGFFSEVFEGVEGNTKDFIPLVKLHVENKLTHSVAVHQILNTYPEENMKQLGMKKMVSERSLYRTLERIGRNFNVLHEKYQNFIWKTELVDSNQVIDFSSTYVLGKKAEFVEFGYSRDKRPDKLQINP